MFCGSIMKSATLGGPHRVIIILENYSLGAYPLGITIGIRFSYHYPLTLLENTPLRAGSAKHRTAQCITVVS